MTFPILFLLLCAWPTGVSAQKKTKDYVSYLRPDGAMMYHIFPQKSFVNPATGADFVMDVTCISNSDSAVVNFTYTDPAELQLQSISLSGPDWQAPVKRIYVSFDRKQWVYRYTFTVPMIRLEQFYRTVSPEISMVCASGAVVLRASKEWKKNAGVSVGVMRVMRANRN